MRSGACGSALDLARQNASPYRTRVQISSFIPLLPICKIAGENRTRQPELKQAARNGSLRWVPALAESFPVSGPEIPVPSGKIPCSLREVLCPNPLNWCHDHRVPHHLMVGFRPKFPVISLLGRDLGVEGFAADCVHSQPVCAFSGFLADDTKGRATGGLLQPWPHRRKHTGRHCRRRDPFLSVAHFHAPVWAG